MGSRELLVSIGLLAAASVSVPVAAQDATTPVGADPESAGARPLRLVSYSLEGLPNGGWTTAVSGELVKSMVYSSLYRIDDRLQPVPDLLVEPCQPSEDGVVLTCTLVETEFHDGTPLTAEDVAYTFELANATCGLPTWYFCQAAEQLDQVETVDERTVRFHLAKPDATFISETLADTRIAARKDIESSFARFDAMASKLDLDEVARIHQALIDDPFDDCSTAIAEPERILIEAGAHLWHRAEFVDPASGGFDACVYAYHLEEQLTALEAYLGATGIDRASASLHLLDIQRHPNGTGPWRVVDHRSGEGMSLEAFAGYHHGPPAVARIEVVLESDAAAAVGPLQAGQIDVLPELPLDLYDAVRDSSSLRLARYPLSGYYFIGYNLRPEGLFAERPLRQAMALCIDKKRTVEAATADQGFAIESDVLPGTWAHQADLRTPERDVEVGRELIESVGWVEGEDGIYERDGQRLAAGLYVRADDPNRVRFAELVAHQVHDCGIDIGVKATDRDELFSMFEPPHHEPGTDKPFDLLMAGWNLSTDPDGRPLWHSQEQPGIEGSGERNFIGYSNPRVDDLLDLAISTYDIRARARAYRQVQDILATDQPYLFAWADPNIDVIAADLASTDGPLDLGRQRWWWELEKLTFDSED